MAPTSALPAQIDGRIEIVTPENIAFSYRTAGPFLRLPAYLLDKILQVLAIATLGLILMFSLGMAGLGSLATGGWLVAIFVVSWFYGGLFETFWNGQTPGKRAFGLRVVAIDGRPINALQAVLRNVLRAVDGLPMFSAVPLFQVGLLACLSNRRYQRLGDLACGTMVILEDRRRLSRVARSADPAVNELALAIPAKFVATRPLAQALSKYVGRRATFSPVRQAEIAGHLARPLIERFGLPANTNADRLLCALYQRTFVADQTLVGSAISAEAENPFASRHSPMTESVESNV